MRTPQKQLLVALVALLGVLGLTACGEKSEELKGSAEAFDLTLDFYPNPDHAGIYAGERLGYFEDAGLDLRVTTPTDPSAPIKQVAAGQTDLAISYEPEVLLARDKGLDVVAVAALVDEPLTSMIWLGDSRIGGIRDLKGRTVATAGIPYQTAYLRSILSRSGVEPGSVDQVDVGLGLLPAILGGRADAILGGFRNVEGVDLAARGKAPVVTPVDELGVPTYDELVLVAQGKRLEEDPDPIRLFIAALARGTRAAVAEPALATSSVLGANDALDPTLTRKETAATLPLLEPEMGRPFGYMDAGEWDGFIRWFRDNGQISSLPAPGEVLSNDYLPGEIPD